MTMNLWLMSVMLYLMGFIIFLGETGKAATSTSCPVKSEINLRGPPEIPGRQEPTGLGVYLWSMNIFYCHQLVYFQVYLNSSL